MIDCTHFPVSQGRSSRACKCSVLYRGVKILPKLLSPWTLEHLGSCLAESWSGSVNTPVGVTECYVLSENIMVVLTYTFMLTGSIGHRPRNATVFCPWPSSPFLSWCIPLPLFLFLCLCQVFHGLPLPWGVPCDGVMVSGGFLNVCPIHLHFLFFITFSMGSCLVIFQSVVLGTLSVHFRCRILRRLLLMKVVALPKLHMKTLQEFDYWFWYFSNLYTK